MGGLRREIKGRGTERKKGDVNGKCRERKKGKRNRKKKAREHYQDDEGECEKNGKMKK